MGGPQAGQMYRRAKEGAAKATPAMMDLIMLSLDLELPAKTLDPVEKQLLLLIIH